MRYSQLLDYIRQARTCEIIVEIGTWNGNRAIELVDTAMRRHERVRYVGFDLFEMLSPEILRDELSKQPPTWQTVTSNLERFRQRKARRSLFRGPRQFEYELHAGYTKDTLAAFTRANPGFRADFIWIDGGHSVETIENDWKYCSTMIRPGAAIFLDDYYDNADLSERFGCSRLVERLRTDPRWRVTVLPTRDFVPKIGGIQIARVDAVA